MRAAICRRGSLKMGVIAIGLFLLSASSAWADTLALDFTGTLQNRVSGENTLGWSFNVNRPIVVTGLGFFDDFTPVDGPGLLQNHLVSLWTSAGTLLAQSTIT